MTPTTLTLGSERDINNEIGKGLENSLKDAKKIDRQIAKSLSHNTSYLNRIPIVNGLVTKFRTIKPLSSLETELRTALTHSLVSMVNLGKRSRQEKERLEQLNEVYNIAKEEEWGSNEFLNFIEANTDLDYTVAVDGEQVDLKEIFKEVDSRLLPERKTEKRQEYLEWFQNHINLSGQYLEAMHALCFVGCEWIGGMTRSYFDLTQLRGGMDEMRKTLQNLGDGGIASIASQQAIRQYGTAYVNGMRSLINGYKKMCALKDSGSNEFRTSLKQLEEDLNSNAPKLESKKVQNQRRLIYNPNNK